jgi:hypothetical protein
MHAHSSRVVVCLDGGVAQTAGYLVRHRLPLGKQKRDRPTKHFESLRYCYPTPPPSSFSRKTHSKQALAMGVLDFISCQDYHYLVLGVDR